MLDHIPCIFVDRKWMRAAKAWRCTIELPDRPQLAACLTALIESKQSITITTDDNKIIIDPVYIVDVPSKGKKFQLVVETCYENQAGNGPILTEMTGCKAMVTIAPPDTEQKPVFEKPEQRGTISEQAIKGLHSAFFKNPRFWQFLQDRTGETSHTEADCKHVFKRLMQVESVKHINQEDFDKLLGEFNSWL